MARILTGIVSSDRPDKTIVVTIQMRKTHPLYKKQYSVQKKIMVHDEDNAAKIGDKVIITETQPQSKRKRYILTKIVEKAAIQHTEEAERGKSE